MRCRQIRALARLRLSPSDWCGIVGVRIVDRRGWAGSGFSEPLPLREFMLRAFNSAVADDGGGGDFDDVLNYLAMEDRI